MAGMAIVIHRSMQFKIVEEIMNGMGRSLLVKGHVMGLMVTLRNVYLPNQGQIQALRSALSLLMDKVKEVVLSGGDFNMVMNLKCDTTSGKTRIAFTTLNKLKPLLRSLQFLDLC